MMTAEVYTSTVLKRFLASGSERALFQVENRMAIASKIYDALVENNLTKNEFAKKLNKRQFTIETWLSGKYNFTCDDLTDIERILNINLLNLK